MRAVRALNLLWGIWLAFNSVTLTHPREALAWNDLICGLAVVGLTLLSLSRAGLDRSSLGWLRWGVALIGIWLLFAPLAFWAPDAASYSNSTLLGFLILSCAAITFRSPASRETAGVKTFSDIPAGWSYNPSAWRQRLPIMTLGFFAFLIARYLAAYQLGHIGSAWDPLFGNSTEAVLESDVSRAFPISDAGLGAFSYLLDAVIAGLGDRRRWKTMPWVVVLFGLLIIPPGVTAITLVILQPLGVGAWCTLCLVTSFLMLIMATFALDEVMATLQFLYRGKKAGYSLWRLFWRGELEATSLSSPMPIQVQEKISRRFHGVALVPSLIVSAVLGIWLMISGAIIPTARPAYSMLYVVAALVVTFSVLAMSDMGRPLRFLNLGLGILLIVSPFVVTGYSAAGVLSSIVTGGLIIGFSLPRGRVQESYGGLQRWAGVAVLRNERVADAKAAGKSRAA